MNKYFSYFLIISILFLGPQCQQSKVNSNIASVIFEDNDLRSQFKTWCDTVRELSKKNMIGNWANSELSVDVSVDQNCFIMINSRDRQNQGVFKKTSNFHFVVGNIAYDGLAITLPPNIEKRINQLDTSIRLSISTFDSSDKTYPIIMVEFNRSGLLYADNSPRDEMPWLDIKKSDEKLHLFSL